MSDRIEEIKARCDKAIHGSHYSQDVPFLLGEIASGEESLKHTVKNLELACDEIDKLTAERDAAVIAVNNMAEYIVTKGRVDEFLCDEIPEELHWEHQGNMDGNYANGPCVKCVAEYFTLIGERRESEGVKE